VVELEGNPWFVAADLYRAIDLPLGSQNYHMTRLASDEKGYDKFATIRGTQRLRIVSESGMYKIVSRSDRPEAREFQDWIARVVLPSIRKNGGYIKDQEKVVTGEMSPQELALKDR
jgi:prophage antirepressor-like protein